jgi:hypothetical protein
MEKPHQGSRILGLSKEISNNTELIITSMGFKNLIIEKILRQFQRESKKRE